MLEKLPPRERQVVDLLYARGEATVAELCDALPDRLSDSAVRAMLTRLEAKGFVRRSHGEKGYVFAPAVAPAVAKENALRQLVRTFFNNNPAGAASALLGMSETLEDSELDEIEQAIRKARQERSR